MIKSRINDTEIIVGRKGTGKSTYGNKRARAYPKDKKVLIVDVNGAPAYAMHRQIDDKTLLSSRWKKGIVRYYNSDHKVMMNNIIRHCNEFNNDSKGKKKGILIIFEDCTKYIGPHPPDLVKQFLVDHRMWNADLIFTFHSFKRIPPFFFEMCSYVTILKTQETFDTSRNRNAVPNFEAIARARQKVLEDPSPYKHITVPTLI